MNGNFVLGTLTALNSVLGPLAGPINPKQIYPLTLHESQACPRSPRDFLGVQLDWSLGRDARLQVKGEICRTRLTARTVAVAVSLPADMLDPEFIAKLPVGAPYVASGVPSATEKNVRERVRITRLENEGELMPVRVEWVPPKGAAAPAHGPITVWYNPRLSSQMPWQKIEMTDLSTLMPGALAIGPAPGSSPGAAPLREPATDSSFSGSTRSE